MDFAITAPKDFFSSLFFTFQWDYFTDSLQKMYKKLNDKRFYYGEDIAITYPAFAEIKTMVVIPKSYYMHRQRNNGSVPSYISCDTYFDEAYSLTNYLRMQIAFHLVWKRRQKMKPRTLLNANE